MNMPAKIIIAYKTRVVPGFVVDASGLSAPANYKDQAKIDAWLADKRAELEAEASRTPYSCTFDEVQISDLKHGKKFDFKYREPGSGKQPLCVAVRNLLLKQFPTAWPNTTHPKRSGEPPEAIFVGFDPKRFLKILGIECSLPQNQADPENPTFLPLSMWYGNSDHRDIKEAVLPLDYARTLSWRQVLDARGLGAKYKDWTGPGVDVAQDLLLATDLAGQLGMLTDE